jgi:hypothetical protein
MNNPSAFPGKQKALLIKSEHSDIAKEYEIDQNGMTLRDYFAAKAMQGGIDLVPHMATPKVDKTMPQIIAEMAYEYADAMLKAREVKHDAPTQ